MRYLSYVQKIFPKCAIIVKSQDDWRNQTRSVQRITSVDSSDIANMSDHSNNEIQKLNDHDNTITMMVFLLIVNIIDIKFKAGCGLND